MENTASQDISLNAAAFQVWLRQIAATNDDQIHRLKKNLRIAIEQDLTSRQRQMLSMYYFDNKKMEEIAVDLGVNKSTVSRTISRGVRRPQKALKYSF